MLRCFFLILLAHRRRDRRHLRLPRAEEHGIADRDFPGHGSSAKVQRAGAARIFCRMAAAIASRWPGPCRWVTTCRRPSTTPGRRHAQRRLPHSRSASARAPIIYNTGKMGDRLGHGIPVADYRGVDGAWPATIQHQLRGLPRRDARRKRHHQAVRPDDGCQPCRTSESATCRTAKFSTRSPTARTPCWLMGRNVTVDGSVGDHRLCARAATQPERHRLADVRLRQHRTELEKPMSEHSHVLPTPEGEYFENSALRRACRYCSPSSQLWVLVGSVIGAYLSPQQFAFPGCLRFAYFFTLCAGSLFWTIVHHATDSEWSVVVRRQLENIGMLCPVGLRCSSSDLCCLRHSSTNG